MIPIFLIIATPFIAAFLILISRNTIAKNYLGWFVLAFPLILFASLCTYIPSISKGKNFIETVQWIPSFDLYLSAYADGLSLLFGLLITGIGSLVILYSIYYMKSEQSLHVFYIYLLLFMGAMLGVVFSDHMLVLYTFWELTSVTSFLLIAFWYHRKRSRYGALKSMLITVFGGIGMLVAFLMIHQVTGTFSIRETIEQVNILQNHPLFVPVMLLLLFGAFTKSAQFPFHIWLPDAMEAPTPVSSYLHSATMVKAGIFLVARFTPLFGGSTLWFWIITVTGMVTMLWGSFIAIRQRDLKALLAYSTVSQLGLIMSLLGIGSYALHTGNIGLTGFSGTALFAALFHLINHSTFKGSLFMVVGIVDSTVGTRDLKRLGGLYIMMPITFVITLISSFSMAGLPPFNGFLSKEMFFTEVLKVNELSIFSLETWGIFLPVIAVAASVMTFVYSMIIVFQTFLGKHQPDLLNQKAKEAPIGMLIAPALLAIIIILIFIWPNVLGDYIIYPALLSIMPSAPQMNPLTISVWHGWTPELFMTFAVILLGILITAFLSVWKKIYRLLPDGLTIDALYQKILSSLEHIAGSSTRLYMTGYTTDYLVYVYVSFALLISPMLFVQGGFQIDFSRDAPLELFEVIMTAVMITSAIGIVLSRTRLTSVIFNGVLGYSISFFFVLFRAPDLALTQLVVETVTTALFLASFYFLPSLKIENTTKKKRVSKLLIATATGTIFTITALAVKSFVQFDSISSFFEDSVQLSGGENIVNAILGDFRAFDTMLEAIVLFIAGLGVYVLIKVTGHRRENR
ncbi:Na+/H+ antiporter subunit A [Aciduricibacillus chroicocephali]|uniref:Na+/H+ antiporter subunit A n=1 Tax=Aciduricibacillus chroicocephali TaxID=3054939 RepID=A0ABY9KVR5_9BACI|nr:Na+/H+ antiporter subunit A [Bacillaceae bacterium 44XB]